MAAGDYDQAKMVSEIFSGVMESMKPILKVTRDPNTSNQKKVSEFMNGLGTMFQSLTPYMSEFMADVFEFNGIKYLIKKDHPSEYKVDVSVSSDGCSFLTFINTVGKSLTYNVEEGKCVGNSEDIFDVTQLIVLPKEDCIVSVSLNEAKDSRHLIFCFGKEAAKPTSKKTFKDEPLKDDVV